MQLEQYKIAQKRMLRRVQLWHTARLACESYEQFRANLAAIERAVAATLQREFGT